MCAGARLEGIKIGVYSTHARRELRLIAGGNSFGLFVLTIIVNISIISIPVQFLPLLTLHITNYHIFQFPCVFVEAL